ncbi:MAG TPA: LETM1 domain-containing protein [Anaeromyxobacter sp.]|nr:LETM1 domain-containing protein [Anaeromyxobacter sp.]
MAKPFPDKTWLATLVDDALRSHEVGTLGSRTAADLVAAQKLDFAASARIVVARSLRARRRPLAPADERERFLELVQQHLLLLLDLLLLAPAAFPAGEQRTVVAATLAAALGAEGLAIEALHAESSEARTKSVQQALGVAGAALRARFYPPGDPRTGLPLSSGATAVLRRHLARVVGGVARGGALEQEALRRHTEYAARELALLAEALAGLVGTVAAPGRREAWVRRRQMARLGLRGPILREARRRVAKPRPPEELALAAPEPMRGFLFEQLLLAQLRAHLPAEKAGRYVEAFAQAARLDPQVVMAAQVEAAAQSGDPQAWFEDSEGRGGALDWHELAGDFGEAADKVADRVSTAVTQNLGALVTEIRETGELGTLLTRAAAGQRLSAEEKRKIRSQLIDLAKAVPALALFAAPGGSLLLPVLVKLLPFNLLPSAWEKVGTEPRPALPEHAPEAAEGELVPAVPTKKPAA